jgi:hypothetical protein
MAALGLPLAAAYQYHLTRQRITREPRSRRPGQPWVMGIMMSAAKSGPPAWKVQNGIEPHEIA